jgi:hypothetical protein
MMSSNQILQMQRLQRERMQQQAHSPVPQQPAFFLFPGQQPQQPMIQPPLTVDMNPILEQTVLAIQREYTPDNSNNIYDNKTKEYFQFCDHRYPTDNYNKVLDANKLNRFMFYQAFRNQKKRGGERVTENLVQFDPVDYVLRNSLIRA